MNTPTSTQLSWTRNAPGSYSTRPASGLTYTAYGDCVSADIARHEWKVAAQVGTEPWTHLGQAPTLKEAKAVAQRHHDATGREQES